MIGWRFGTPHDGKPRPTPVTSLVERLRPYRPNTVVRARQLVIALAVWLFLLRGAAAAFRPMACLGSSRKRPHPLGRASMRWVAGSLPALPEQTGNAGVSGRRKRPNPQRYPFTARLFERGRDSSGGSRHWEAGGAVARHPMVKRDRDREQCLLRDQAVVSALGLSLIHI